MLGVVAVGGLASRRVEIDLEPRVARRRRGQLTVIVRHGCGTEKPCVRAGLPVFSALNT